jgi:tRNA A58 N-methylase Trm61
MPTRKTARMIENVYVVPPSSSDSRRVQMTSAPSAVRPESAMVKYTAVVPGARTTGVPVVASFRVS